MAGHPARDRSVRWAASQSGRATYEISRRSSSTAVTSATSITAKFLSSHSKIMRWHHDNAPDASKISRKWVSVPSDGTANRRAGPCLGFRYTQGALATQPWENGPPCEPALGYWSIGVTNRRNNSLLRREH